MKSEKLLIIEDEPKVANFIKQGLEENLYTSDIALDGQEGLKLALTGNYKLIILDLNLPNLNGQNICNQIRLKKNKTPIIILTALSTIDDKILGFENGANDYIVKPFEFRELLARVKVHLKHNEDNFPNDSIIKISDLELNTESKTVIRNNKPIELTAKEFALLELLMRNEGKVFSRREIAEKIWEINFDSGTNVIDVYINFLRKKVDKNFDSKLIHTQIGMGYVLKKI